MDSLTLDTCRAGLNDEDRVFNEMPRWFLLSAETRTLGRSSRRSALDSLGELRRAVSLEAYAVTYPGDAEVNDALRDASESPSIALWYAAVSVRVRAGERRFEIVTAFSGYWPRTTFFHINGPGQRETFWSLVGQVIPRSRCKHSTPCRATGEDSDPIEGKHTPYCSWGSLEMKTLQVILQRN